MTVSAKKLIQRPAIEKALTRLVIKQPWFASLAMRLELREDPKIPTAATNGIYLYYNPTWFDSIERSQQEAVWAHEVMHVVFNHVTRRGNRHPMIWNMAGDHVINLELVESGFTLPGECLMDPRFKGMTTDQVYNILYQEIKNNAKKGGKGQKGKGFSLDDPYTDPLGCPQDYKPEGSQGSGANGSEISDPGASVDELEASWREAHNQATAVAQKAGHCPMGASRAAKAAGLPQIPWQEKVQRYLTAMGDQSWTKPNRRFIHRGLYLPGMLPGRPGPIAIAVDTSGSVSDQMLSHFASEVNGILGVCGFPEKVTIIYCDAAVQLVEEPTALPIDLAGKGGGGTLSKPIFDHIAQMETQPLVLFYLTDLELGDTPQPQPYDVVWITPKWCRVAQPPFGELVRIETGDY